MKPWRPYWKGLERAIAALLRAGDRFDVPSLIPLDKWVARLTYSQLLIANSDCEHLWGWLLNQGEEDCSWEFSPMFAGEHHRLQLYLRCLYALDFCKGRVGRRKEFDWKQDPALVYKALLIDSWSSEALYWINRCDPEILEVNEFGTLLSFETECQDETKNLN